MAILKSAINNVVRSFNFSRVQFYLDQIQSKTNGMGLIISEDLSNSKMS